MHVPLTHRLYTERLCLRSVTEADLPYVWSASRVAGFNDGMRWDPPAGPEELRGPYEQNLQDWRAGTAYTFTVETVAGAFVGRVGLYAAGSPGTWYVGYWVHPDQQGAGYATEATQAAVAFTFDVLEAQRVVSSYASWNVASGRVLAKLGAWQTGTRAHGFEKGGRWVPEIDVELPRPAPTP